MLDFNPFESDVVAEPRRVDQNVVGLNDDALDVLLDEFRKLADGEPPRIHRRLNQVQFVTSPEPGYGKSHLIGRLFHQLSGQANLIYLKPFQNYESPWKSILEKVIQEMEFPDKTELESCTSEQPSQLEVFAHGVLSGLAILALSHDRVNMPHRQKGIELLRKKSLVAFRQSGQNKKWMKKHLNTFMAHLGKVTGPLHFSKSTWLNLLYTIAYDTSDTVNNEACLDWLKGNSIDQEAADNMAAKNHAADMSTAATNELGKNLIVDLCNLAAFHRPFVFCFDQTEGYKYPELAASLGLVIETLWTDAHNQMTVVTANRKPWDVSIKPNWEEAQIQRLRYPALELRGLNRVQALNLVRQRLANLPMVTPDKKQLMEDNSWLKAYFSDSSEIGVRAFIRECRIRWSGHRSIELPLLEQLFVKGLEEIKSQPKKQVFDRDALYWAVSEPAALITENSVTIVSSPKGYFGISWQTKDKSILFGFEAGNHHSRWKAIADEAEKLGKIDQKFKAVLMRTPELPAIPKDSQAKTWQRVADVMKSNLNVFILDVEEMLSIYTCRNLYLDALEGNIPFPPGEVMKFAHNRLQPLWMRIMEPAGQKKNSRAQSTIKAVAATPSAELVAEVRRVVEEERFLSFTDLMAKLNQVWPEEVVHRARGCIKEIKVMAGPTMTVLIWQPQK